MLLNEYQDLAQSTAIYPQNDDLDYVYTIMGLANEAGEVAGVYKKFVRGDYGKDETKERIGKELGDVLWYVAEIAYCFGFTLEEIAEANLSKLKDRQQRNVLQGHGDER